MIEYNSGFDKKLPDISHHDVHDSNHTFRQSYIRQTNTFQSEPATKQERSPIRSVIWPVLIISLPITILTTILLVIVFTNRVKPQTNSLDGSDQKQQYQNDILVNFSASK